ncbi:hypothetical protein CTZ27_31970 [Streptomyces griseocarneus]|nr:hypothetical protein CTZ27_31970 [Streptomyces griseocarneus]
MKLVTPATALAAVCALCAGLFWYDTAAAEAPQIITCDAAWTMRFSPGLTTTPQNVTATVGNPRTALRNCTGDPGMTMGDAAAGGTGTNATCALGSYTGNQDTVAWTTTDTQPKSSTYSWGMHALGDLLSVQTPLSGGFSDGRYKGATWTMAIDPVQSKIDLTPCTTPTGVTSIDVVSKVVITTAG